MNSRVKKGLDIASTVIIIIIFIFGIVIMAAALSKNEDGIPSVFGVSFVDIKTDSMQGTLNVKDVAIIKKVNDVSEIEVGDIITFKFQKDGKDELNTHKVIEIIPNEDNPSLTRFRTQGDNEELPDAETVILSRIVGKYVFRIPGFGHVTWFLQQWYGFVIVIILPLGAYLVYRIIVLARVISQLNKEKVSAAVATESDTLKAELEALRQKVAMMEGGEPAPPEIAVETPIVAAPPVDVFDPDDSDDVAPEKQEKLAEIKEVEEKPVIAFDPDDDDDLDEEKRQKLLRAQQAAEMQAAEVDDSAVEPSIEYAEQRIKAVGLSGNVDDFLSDDESDEPKVSPAPKKTTTAKKPAAKTSATAKKPTSTTAKKT